jgi:hypothetical protein
MNQIIFLILLATAILGGCAGTESNDPDNTPPAILSLISHLGDTGDLVSRLDTLNYYKEPFNQFGYAGYDSEYNGIDAVSEDDKIQIQISNVGVDISDIDYINLYRFSLEDYYNNPDAGAFFVKTQEFPGSSFLITDDFSEGILPIGKSWFYFIKSFDAAGNSSVSDTVCYKILEKPILLSPDNDTNFNHLSDILFHWNLDDTSDIISYRILLFDYEYNLLWYFEPVDHEDPTEYFPYTGPDYGTGNYIWRVDGFGYGDDVTLNETPYFIFSGTESYERSFSVD